MNAQARCMIRLGHGCAAKTWATAPPLKTVVLSGSMASGARKSRPARTQDGRVDDKAVLVDQAGLDQRSGEPCPAVGEQVSVGALLLEPRDGFGQVSGGDRRLTPVGGRERVREHDLGDLVHRLGERPGGGGPVIGPPRVGGGTHEVRAGVAHGLDGPTEGVIGGPAAIQSVLPSAGAT